MERIHVSLTPLNTRDAAIFLASALLVSHGVRRDSTAVVKLSRPRSWLLARGDSVRHLRPDVDSAEGWIRAVTSGKSRLGGVLVEGLDLEGLIRGCYRLCFHSQAHALLFPWSAPRDCIAILYAKETLERPGCDGEAPTGPIPLPLLPAVGNVIVDRAVAGKGIV